jgi:energy-coupling factor transport system permease protein
MIFKRARFLLYFGIFIFLIQLLFTPGDKVLLNIIPESAPLYPGSLSLTYEGLTLGLSMTMRFLVIVLSSFWFISVTDPNKLASALMQFGLPYRYGFMLVTSLRFLPQFEIESNTVHNAQLTRGIKIRKNGLRNIYNHVKFTMRPLIISALQKADTLSRSMEGRGFGLYKTRTFIDQTKFSKKDLLITCLIVFTTILLIIIFNIVYDLTEFVKLLIP